LDLFIYHLLFFFNHIIKLTDLIDPDRSTTLVSNFSFFFKNASPSHFIVQDTILDLLELFFIFFIECFFFISDLQYLINLNYDS
jgi:hypothetical protein